MAKERTVMTSQFIEQVFFHFVCYEKINFDLIHFYDNYLGNICHGVFNMGFIFVTI